MDLPTAMGRSTGDLTCVRYQVSYINTWKVRLRSYTYGKVSEKRDLACIIKKHNKNALRLKCYNFRRVNAIVFLFSALHTTPFLYGKIHCGILNMLHASIAMSDTPRGSNPPYLSVGVIKSLQIRFVGGEVLYLSICSVRYFLCNPLRRYS